MPKKRIKGLIYTIITATTLVALLFSPINVVRASCCSLKVIAGEKTYEFSSSEIGVYKGNYYLKNAKNIVDGIFLDTVVRPKDATVVFNASCENPFTIIKEKKGLQIDKLKLLQDIYDALNENKSVVTAKFKETKAKTTANSLIGQTEKRSEFSTNYTYSTSDRKHNIAFASLKPFSTVLNPTLLLK